MEEKTTITKEMVTYVAELSRISLDEAETEKMQDELGAVVAYMDILNSLDTTGIEPLSHVFDMVFSKSKDERATAVIAGNDFIAASIMQYVKKLGMKIPDDLAVVGADNTFIAEIVSPTLTSIDFSKEEFSQKLVDTLMALLRGEKAMDQYIPVSLCVRESA